MEVASRVHACFTSQHCQFMCKLLLQHLIYLSLIGEHSGVSVEPQWGGLGVQPHHGSNVIPHRLGSTGYRHALRHVNDLSLGDDDLGLKTHQMVHEKVAIIIGSRDPRPLPSALPISLYE
eukprot:scaffold70684_cov39-Prasinocladus_malaysianus.AAC.1